MIELLIADDHPIFRDGLKKIIAEEDQLTIKDEASNGRQVLALLEDNRYDALVMDIEMPELGGLDVLKEMADRDLPIPVLILSFYPEEQYAIRAMKLGASGYLTKDSAALELVEALRRVVSGKKYITASLAERLAEHVDGKAADVPHERIRHFREVPEDEQALANNLVKENEFDNGRKAMFPSTPLQFARNKSVAYKRGPLLGEHTREVLAELGYSPDHIEDMIKNKALRSR